MTNMFPTKARNRSYLSQRPEKEAYVFGPQFTIQASAVTERGPKVLNQAEAVSLKTNDLLNTNSSVRRSVSSGLEGSFATNHSDYQRIQQRAHSKRQVLTSTAFAHDIGSQGSHVDHISETSSVLSINHPCDLDLRASRSAQSSHRMQQGSSYVFLPGDRVMFSESLTTPGVPIVYRTPEERSANPDRLNLDRRHLAVCPILEGEEQLRLLNYQHNLISSIQHLSSLKRLIFLDLYDNQIEEISGLSSLKSLRVLMLGKNRIRQIEELECLTKLDVLDLHGNEIRVIEKLNHLSELRVLNLAGNKIQHVNNLHGMNALTELNLRRNCIHSVNDIEKLSSLQRLFLSFNEITSFDDIQCLSLSRSLLEVSLDGNPFSQDVHYKQTMLRFILQLRQLDMKRISEDERRIAQVMAKKDEDKKKESNKIAMIKERRKMAISNARKQWEDMQKAMSQHRSGKHTELYASHVANVPYIESGDEQPEALSGSQVNSRPTSAKSLTSEKSEWLSKTFSRTGSQSSNLSAAVDKENMNGDSECAINSDFLSELDGDTLSLYGVGALDAFEKNWGIQAAGAVTTICFKFIDFVDVAKVLHKIRVRFPNVITLYFNSTNISSLAQVNALSAVRRIDNLIIDTDGNPITNFQLWRTYLLFRLAHFCLKKINDVEVSASDIVNAEKYFGTLAHLTTSQLTQARLLALLGEKKRQLLVDERTKKSEGRVTERNTETVGRAGLVYTSPDVLAQRLQDAARQQKFVRHYVKELTYDAIQVNQKQSALQSLWPQVLVEMVSSAVHEMWDTDSYMKQSLEAVEKS